MKRWKDRLLVMLGALEAEPGECLRFLHYSPCDLSSHDGQEVFSSAHRRGGETWWCPSPFRLRPKTRPTLLANP